ncbi:hypothetical protein GQ44DRAFT_757274 [Phaeosphaeriaceae sp. PMI808]|nr:hypothetical protein GQ44DRAFT_757274 [Phaeosphaeriaceae sp. PMI808]
MLIHTQNHHHTSLPQITRHSSTTKANSPSSPPPPTPTTTTYSSSPNTESHYPPAPSTHHHLSDLLSTFLTHMFALASCQACTSSQPCWTTDYKARIVVDDEYVLLDEDEDDGGPLCREAVIDGWKMTKGRKRRLSVHSFGGQ